MENNCQKIKLLKLMEILRDKTDEDNPLSRSELCVMLENMNISCDVRTMTKDIKLLNDSGYEIMSVQRGHEKCYYIEDRSFSVPEIKIMIDAVQAATFITNKKSEELVSKLAFLGGENKAEILKGNMVRFNTRKHSNESIYYNVDTIESAIINKKKVSFHYFYLNEKKEKVYQNADWNYTVHPVALIFSDDNYYLMTWHSKYQKVTNYRVDRMDRVRVMDEDVSPEVAALIDKVADYTEEAFQMFNGKRIEITFQFENSVTPAVYDKFGEDTVIKRTGDNALVATVTVQDSPVFRGWLYQFGEKIKVLEEKELGE